MKITLPAEQALSMFFFAAHAMDRANAGDADAESLLRILTPLLKFRACRDNIPVATGAMEVRGGNGYIEEWVQCAAGARRPYRRALGRHQQHQRARHHHPRRRQEPRASAARRCADAAAGRGNRHSRRRSATGCGRRSTARLHLAERVAAEDALEDQARKAASGLYHITSAVLMTWEASRPGADARRALYARLVLEHRLGVQDPLALDGRLGARGGGIAAERAERIAG